MTASPSIAPSRRLPAGKSAPPAAPAGKLAAPAAAGKTQRRKRLPDEPITTLRGAINSHVGGRIRALRISQGKTQAELGVALGLSNQQIQKYERGTNAVTLERLWLSARYLGVDLDYLLSGVETAALVAFPESETGDPVKFRRLRLALAEAMQRADSPELLSSILQVLRAAETDAAERAAHA